MNLLRRISTRRLIALLTGVAVVALLGGIALARAGGTAPPPKRPLADALSHSLSAAPVQGVSARIKFTNNLFPSGALPEGTASALLTGASGRLWVSSDGRFRLELQSEAGDAQVMGSPTGVIVYDASSNTEYRIPISQHPDAANGAATDSHKTLGMADLQRAITRVSTMANLTGAMPTSIAGRPAYTVRISPKHDGGLLGALGLGWDAEHAVPLQIAVYARGDSSPTLALTATQIHYGPVSDSALKVTPATGVKVVTVQAPSHSESGSSSDGARPEVTGAAAVASKLGFPLAAPDTLVGLPRHSVRLVDWQGTPAALVVYGKGLGAVVVLEQPTTAGQSSPLSQLPRISIAGGSGNELATSLGTVIRFEHGGVTTTVAGSVPAVAAEAAARQLAGS